MLLNFILIFSQIFVLYQFLLLMQPGAVYVSQTLKFKLPVYFGEEVHAEIQATNIRKRNDKYMFDTNRPLFVFRVQLYLFLINRFCSCGSVYFATKCFTTEDSLVVEGEAATILPTLFIGDSKS